METEQQNSQQPLEEVANTTATRPARRRKATANKHVTPPALKTAALESSANDGVTSRRRSSQRSKRK